MYFFILLVKKEKCLVIKNIKICVKNRQKKSQATFCDVTWLKDKICT